MTKELLLEYIDLNYSISEICAAENLSNGSVCYWLKKYGLKTNHKRADMSIKALWRNREDRPRKYSPSKTRASRRKKDTELNSVDWKTIQSIYDSGLNYIQTANRASISVSVLRRGVIKGLLKPRTKSESLQIYRKSHPRPPASQETRSKISMARKKHMKDNPNWHWRDPERFNSVPCEEFKQALKDAGLFFTEEYQPLRHKDRYYCIDIAFVDIKVGIEINGTQHYRHGEVLNEYHQTRHDLIVDEGWELIEVLYAKSFNKEFRSEMINLLRSKMAAPPRLERETQG